MVEKKKYNQKVTIQDVYDYCNKEEVNFNFIGDESELVNSRSKLTFMCMSCNSSFTKDFTEIKSRKQTQCGSCGRKARGIRQKEQSFKETLELCNELGLKCLSKTFNGMHDDLEFECTSCSESFLRRPIVLKKDRVTICRDCSYKRHGNGLKYSYNEVYNIFKDGGCMLLSRDYKSNKQKLEYICECGEESTIALSNFMYGQRCNKCKLVKQANSKRTPYEDIKQFFEDYDCTLLSEKFINSNLDLIYKCSCGEVAKTRWARFYRSTHKCCADCAQKLGTEKIKGENHPFWNPNLTDEDRISRRYDNRNKIWRNLVYKRDEYTCQCCGDSSGGNLRAHHKDGYHWCEDRRYDVDNGITLCEECHKSFHIKYGYGNNTEKQIEKYLIDNSTYREKEVAQ